jgi:hypothetical protein
MATVAHDLETRDAARSDQTTYAAAGAETAVEVHRHHEVEQEGLLPNSQIRLVLIQRHLALLLAM